LRQCSDGDPAARLASTTKEKDMPHPRSGRHRIARRVVAGGTGLAVALVGLQAASGAAADDSPGDATYPAVLDPGTGADDYFSPLWPDDGGEHVQAHGGQVVQSEEDGRTVYYWYGEDRSNGYYGSPGVHAYKSYDTKNWTDEGVVLRSVSDPAELESAYFDDLYDTVDDAGQPRADRIAELDYHLDTSEAADRTTIFERPKVLYNSTTDQWVLWWHSDGQTTSGGSMYARSMAGVAVSDSPTGPFRMTGVYRMPNRTNYQDCISAAVPGQARDMTVFQDDDGTAYIVYSSEENRSLYVAELDEAYTNVTHTTATDMVGAGQYSEDGRYPYLFADGTAEAPVRGEDFQIVKECGMLGARAVRARRPVLRRRVRRDGMGPQPADVLHGRQHPRAVDPGGRSRRPGRGRPVQHDPRGRRRAAVRRRHAPVHVRLAVHERARPGRRPVRLHGRPLERRRGRLDVRVAADHHRRERARRDAQPRRGGPEALG